MSTGVRRRPPKRASDGSPAGSQPVDPQNADAAGYGGSLCGVERLGDELSDDLGGAEEDA